MAVRRASFSRKFRYYVAGFRYYLWLCWKLLPIATVLACVLFAVVVMGIAESVAYSLVPSRRAKRLAADKWIVEENKRLAEESAQRYLALDPTNE